MNDWTQEITLKTRKADTVVRLGIRLSDSGEVVAAAVQTDWMRNNTRVATPAEVVEGWAEAINQFPPDLRLRILAGIKT